MARLFLFLNLLEEAHELDLIASRRRRRRAQTVRNLPRRNRSEEFVSIYRLSEDLIQDLINELRPLLTTTKRKGRRLTNRTKILCALSFLANGSHKKSVGKNNTYLSQTSVPRCIKEIVEALNHPTIVKKYLRFPQHASERQLLKQKVIGCIGGTFVAILRPHENEESYYCPQGFHAKTVMLIVDADLNILHVDPSYGGATHDSFVFNNSVIKHNLEDLTNSGETVHLLGGSGYPQLSYLMTPISGADDNTPEAYYNKQHVTAYSTVEQAIGVLKARFRCLLGHRVLHYHTDTAAKIIVACCVLHNICNRAGLPVPVLNEEEMQTQSSSIQNRQSSELLMGQNSRMNLINRLWQNRM